MYYPFMAKEKTDNVARTVYITKKTDRRIDSFVKAHPELKIGMLVDIAVNKVIDKYEAVCI
jgi:hypothetical protein